MNTLANLKNQLIERANQSPVLQRWLHLPARDRMALGMLGAFLALMLFYLLVWQPVAGKFEQARAHHEQQRELYAYLLQNADHARLLLKSGKTQLTPDQLQSVVTASAQQHGLALDRFDNEGQNGLQVSLTQAAFEPMLRWLSELQDKGVRLTEVNLDRADTGKVDARLTLSVGEG
nr:type II secretion system protein M [uncultured Pseudomonas sp.]